MTISRKFFCEGASVPKCSTTGLRGQTVAQASNRIIGVHRKLWFLNRSVCRHTDVVNTQHQPPRRHIKKYMEHRGPPTLYVTRPAASGAADDNKHGPPQNHARHNSHRNLIQTRTVLQNGNKEQRHIRQVIAAPPCVTDSPHPRRDLASYTTLKISLILIDL